MSNNSHLPVCLLPATCFTCSSSFIAKHFNLQSPFYPTWQEKLVFLRPNKIKIQVIQGPIQTKRRGQHSKQNQYGSMTQTLHVLSMNSAGFLIIPYDIYQIKCGKVTPPFLLRACFQAWIWFGCTPFGLFCMLNYAIYLCEVFITEEFLIWRNMTWFFYQNLLVLPSYCSELRHKVYAKKKEGLSVDV